MLVQRYCLEDSNVENLARFFFDGRETWNNKTSTEEIPRFQVWSEIYEIYLVRVALKHSLFQFSFSALPIINLNFFKKIVFFLLTSTAKTSVEFLSTLQFLRNQDAAFGSASHIFSEFSAWKFASKFYLWHQTVAGCVEVLTENVQIWNWLERWTWRRVQYEQNSWFTFGGVNLNMAVF